MKEIKIALDNPVLLGNQVTLGVTPIEEEIKSAEWEFNEILLEVVEQNHETLIIDPMLTGSYEISYKAKTNKGEYIATTTLIVEEVKQENPFPDNNLEENEANENIFDVYNEVLVNNYGSYNHKYPHVVKRNARYRGHRESEKISFRDYEMIFDLNKHYQDLKKHNKIVKHALDTWFLGKIGDRIVKRNIRQEKVFRASTSQNTYDLNESELIRSFENMVVKVDNKIIDSSNYSIVNHSLNIDIESLNIPDGATLYVEYNAILHIEESQMEGIERLFNRYTEMDKKIFELERRYMSLENAYK